MHLLAFFFAVATELLANSDALIGPEGPMETSLMEISGEGVEKSVLG